MSEGDKIWYAPNRFDAYGQGEIDAVVDCLKEGWLAGFGERTVQFEKETSSLFNKQFGVFVNSGSSANLLALASLELPKGSRILTAACNFSTTVAPIVQLGHTPIFCDVQIDTYVPTVDMILNELSADLRVIMLPDLIGSRPDWLWLRKELDRLGRDDIILIEDACDTVCKTSESHIATTSFYASHVITAGGQGGMLMINDQSLVKKALQYRDWGRLGDNSEELNDRFTEPLGDIEYDNKYLYSVLGYNFKSSEMNAAFGLVQLQKLKLTLAKRRKLIERYLSNLRGVGDLVLPNDSQKPNWLAFPIQTSRRLELIKHLEAKNIQTRMAFAGNITRHPAFSEHLQPFENADRIMRNGLLVGAHHGMNDSDVDRVCKEIETFFAA